MSDLHGFHGSRTGGGTGKGCHEQRNIERQQCRTLITVELFY